MGCAALDLHGRARALRATTLDELGIEHLHALSSQAKGRVAAPLRMVTDQLRDDIFTVPRHP